MATYEPISQEDDENEEVVQEPSLSPLRSLGASAMPILNMPVITIDGNIYPVTHTGVLKGVLPVSKGGTGLTELDGGRLLASNEDGTLLEEVDVEVQKLAGLTGNIQTQLNNVASGPRTLLATISSSATWSTNPNGDGKVLTIPVTGIRPTDNPVVGLVTSATTDVGLKAERAAYDCIDQITTSNDSITVICFGDTPTTTFSISLHCTGA